MIQQTASKVVSHPSVCSNEEGDRLLLCAVLHTKNKSREQRREKTSSAGEEKSERELRRGIWKQESIGKGFSLQELLITVTGPNCSFKGLDLAGSSC